MSKILFLYNFNSYYNRIIKRYATFSDYEALITPGENTPAAYKGFKREFMNFDFADGVYARHVINIKNNEPLTTKADQPNYVVVEQPFKEGETEVTRLSRWFVLEATRIRGGQYVLSLRRDLLSDYYYEVLGAPTFIQRGCPQQYSDPAIFNKEGFTFNQIKKSEILLNRNKLSGKGAGWIVGYINRQENAEDIGPCKCRQEINLDVPDFDDLPNELKSIITSGTADITVNNYLDTHIAFPIKWAQEELIPGTSTYVVRKNFNDISFNYEYGRGITNLQVTGTTSRDGAYPYFEYFRRLSNNQLLYWTVASIQSYVREYLSDYVQVAIAFQNIINSDTSRTYVTQDLINQYNNTYYLRNGKYYKIVFNRRSQDHYVLKQYTGAQISSQYDELAFRSVVMLLSLLSVSGMDEKVIRNPEWDMNQYAISIDRYMPVYGVTIEESDATEFEVTIPKERNQLLDSPYDMFVMPLGAVTVKGRIGENNFVTLLNTSLAAARGIAATGTALKILDIQVLPYCPFEEVIDSNGDIDLSLADEDIDYTIIKKTSGQDSIDIGVILYPLHSQGTFDYDITDEHDDLSNEVLAYLTRSETVLEQKVLSETSFVRFVSPNFAALYDMNPQKNGNNGATKINIDYYYKPYTPYIHVKPDFDGEYGLYGIETNDPKGLICSGDFSVATASSKWEEYQVQNKNYQNIFDRQIQNLDVNNSIAMEQQKVSGGIGIASSVMQGAAAGAVAGSAAGPWGAAAGAVVGAVGAGVSSGVGFAKDMELLKKSQTEARSYQIDMYTYQLGNIKALPNTLNRVSAFTPNNKIFPFIEIYSCTEVEKQALRDKIKYNGMTIMRIGHIEDFINNEVSYYVQGELIRLEGIDEDSHVIAEIANEIKEGAYYYGSDTSES